MEFPHLPIYSIICRSWVTITPSGTNSLGSWINSCTCSLFRSYISDGILLRMFSRTWVYYMNSVWHMPSRNFMIRYLPNKMTFAVVSCLYKRQELVSYEHIFSLRQPTFHTCFLLSFLTFHWILLNTSLNERTLLVILFLSFVKLTLIFSAVFTFFF